MADERDKLDFERNWQERLSRAVEGAVGKEIRDLVLQGGEGLTQETGTTEKIIWTCGALDLLAENTDEETGREILTSCPASTRLKIFRTLKRLISPAETLTRQWKCCRVSLSISPGKHWDWKKS